jgi:hypothetical protein
MRLLRLATAVILLGAFLGAPVAAREPWERRATAYGRNLMTKEERKAYWREFNALETDSERTAYYNAHVAAMKQRAADRGVSEPEWGPLAPGEESEVTFWRAPYFSDIMTEEEKANYRPSLDAIPDHLDRWRFVAEHIRTMYARGIERGVTVPPTTGFADVFEALGEVPPDAPASITARDAAKAATVGEAGDAPESVEAAPLP